MGKTKKLDVAILRSALLGDLDDERMAALVTADTKDDGLNSLLEAAQTVGTLGIVDWKAEPYETIQQVDRMLSKLGVTAFDWTFIDHLAEMEEGEVMRNCNFLMHVRDQLKTIDLNFVHVNCIDDGFRFAVLRDADYDKISGMAKRNCIRIDGDFYPDEYYTIGKYHLAKSGFAQPKANADRKTVEQEQTARKMKSLRQMLSYGADEPLDAAHSRLAVPTKLDQNFSAWSMQCNIKWFVGEHARRLSHRILTGESACLPLTVEHWRLSLIEREFLEQSYLETHDECPHVDDLEGVSFYDAARYWDLTIAAAGFFYFGYKEEWEACAAFYPMFERRNVITNSGEEDFERMQWELIRFLAKEGAGSDALNALAQTAPFGPLFGTWNDDSYFTAALNALCDCHINDCHAAVRGDSKLHSMGYDLLPVWIMAIARKREQATGRICLPQNALMKIADAYASIPADVPVGETVKELRALYGREYGNQTNFHDAWDGYLARSGL